MTVAATQRADDSAYPSQWRLLRAQIKVVGPVVDPATGNERPQLDVSKPLKIAGIANAAIVDRVNEMLDPRGAVLTNYMNNPVILADHNYSRPIGMATLVEAKDDGLHFEADIGRPDLAPLTDDQLEKRSLIAQGIICTVSVGFIPLEMQPAEYDDAGNLTKAAIYTRWELLEISVVSVPCNADSIFQMKELEMSQKTRPAGTLPMAPVKTTTTAPATTDAPAGSDEPVSGTAGEMLKAVLDHVGGMKELCMKMADGQTELHKKVDALHGKVDALKPGDAEPDEDDKEVTQTPSGTDGTAEPTKALDARITAMETNINKLATALVGLTENIKGMTAGRL